MGNMSASDAAPLPRLGEVYFDVRGESRSMRLSWYADTGVAVFSIWQGGTCTGTFRLPIDELPRMIGALQRGPHGDARAAAGPQDVPRGATEPHGRRAPPVGPGYGPGDDAGQHGPGDYASGEYRSGDYRPGGHVPGGRGGAEQRDQPDHGLPPGPDTGYSDPGLAAAGGYRETGPGDYGRPGAHGRYEQETRAVYPDDSLPGGPGGYRAGRGDAYEDEPTGVYRGDLLSPDYQDEPGARYPDGGRRGSAHPDDPLGDGYREGPRTGGHPDDPLGDGYRQDPLGGDYREGPRTGGHQGDPLTSGYPGDPLGGYREEPGGGHRPDRRGDDYSGDPLTGGYTGERRGGYAEEPMTARYHEDPLTGDYPTGPPDSGYPDADASQDYPAPSGNAGYSPARPYVAPGPGSTGGTAERRGRRRPARGEESDPSPDSFPYGRPPAEREVRGRGR
jgi:hypothetical protein